MWTLNKLPFTMLMTSQIRAKASLLVAAVLIGSSAATSLPTIIILIAGPPMALIPFERNQ